MIIICDIDKKNYINIIIKERFIIYLSHQLRIKNNYNIHTYNTIYIYIYIYTSINHGINDKNTTKNCTWF